MSKAANKDKKPANKQIAANKRARFDYHIRENFEAGIALQGWEVKSIREGRVQLSESYCIVKGGEIFLFGALMQPLLSASTHIVAEAQRTRKLLLHKREITTLIGAVERKGFTIVPLAMYWSKNHVKLDIGLAEGKKDHDKRDAQKERDWDRDKQRVMRSHNKVG